MPALTSLPKEWRTGPDVPGRAALANALWRTNIHEAHIAAAKLLTEAPDQG